MGAAAPAFPCYSSTGQEAGVQGERRGFCCCSLEQGGQGGRRKNSRKAHLYSEDLTKYLLLGNKRWVSSGKGLPYYLPVCLPVSHGPSPTVAFVDTKYQPRISKKWSRPSRTGSAWGTGFWLSFWPRSFLSVLHAD